jgi:SAM-dependent methyltransferase
MGGENTCFVNDNFDTVFAGFNVVDEIDNIDETFEEVKRILKNNGFFIFSFHNKFYWKHFLRSYPVERDDRLIYPRFQSIKEMRELCEEYFTVVKVYGNNLTPYPYFVCINRPSVCSKKGPVYFDIYGFKIKVEGYARSSFFREYKNFIVKKLNKVDLVVRPMDEDYVPKYLIKPNGKKEGLFIDFKKKEVLYQENLSSDFILYYSEPFIEWKDKILLHAGAVEKDGEAVILPAGSGVGKTTMTLYFSKLGYKYLADDWVIIDKNKAYPFFKTMHVFDYNLKDKDIAKKVLGLKRFYYKPYFWLINVMLNVYNNQTIRFVLHKLKKDFKVDVKDIFGDNLGSISDIKYIYWLTKSEGDEYIVGRDLDKTFAERMSHVIMYEHFHFYKAYEQYASIFGGCDYIENRRHKIKDILSSLKDVYKLEGGHNLIFDLQKKSFSRVLISGFFCFLRGPIAWC